jgi:dTDP-4-dehydrorhamnose reductase
MKILLLGKNGQVGWELQRSLSPLGELTALGRSQDGGDLLKMEDVAKGIRQLRPDVIVNAAAYTAVDKAEAEPDLAYEINAGAPAQIAKAAADLGALFVHFSTDYVFDGSGHAPWRETDQTAPLSIYGASKLAGEQAVVASCSQHLIFRTSWVYGTRGANFARTILRLLQERDVLTIINDQFGAPTGAELVADVTAHAIQKWRVDRKHSGVYHLAAAGETSWLEYASYIAKTAQRVAPNFSLVTRDIKAISTKDYQTAARRPLNSRLDTRRLENTFDLSLPHWEGGVDRFLVEALPG